MRGGESGCGRACLGEGGGVFWQQFLELMAFGRGSFSSWGLENEGGVHSGAGQGGQGQSIGQ